MTTEEKIFSKLISFGMTVAVASRLLGNLEAESALNPKNLQNNYEKSLEYMKISYTRAIGNDTYYNFVKDYGTT